MDNFKSWYTDKKGKYILFFGFYIVFFIMLSIYIRSAKQEQEEPKKEEMKVEEKISTYDMTNLINSFYKYEIVINDNEEIITFSGSKDDIDYANFSNKYFLDIYNINQLLKKSKFIENKDNILYYELSNTEINDILFTDKEEGINKIKVSVNDKGEVNRIGMDLSKYMEKEKYEIDITYIIGENNENSAS